MVTQDTKKEKMVPLGIRLYPSELEALRNYAKDEHRSLSSYVRLALLEKLDVQEAES